MAKTCRTSLERLSSAASLIFPKTTQRLKCCSLKLSCFTGPISFALGELSSRAATACCYCYDVVMKASTAAAHCVAVVTATGKVS